MKRLRLTLTALTILCALTAGAIGQEPAPGTPPAPWTEEEVYLASTLGVQDSGRIKPLSTYAAFKLLKFNSKRSFKTADGRKMSPTEWLMDCLFYPEAAQNHPVFTVDAYEVIEGIGLKPNTKRRGHYAYNDLLPARTRLFELATQFSRMEPTTQTPVQEQTVRLAENLAEFETIIQFSTFARKPFQLNDAPPALAKIFPDRTEVALSDMLEAAQALQDAYLALRQGTEQEGQASEANQAELEAFARVFAGLDWVRESASALALFPPAPADETQWLTPGDLVLRAFDGKLAKEELILLRGFEALAKAAENRGRFLELLSSFHEYAKQLAMQRAEYGKIDLEVAFYKAKLFFRALVFYIFAFVIIALTWLAPKNRLLKWAGPVVLLIPTALLVAGIAMRCAIRGRPPVTTLYETILFVTATTVVLSFFLEFFSRQRIALSLGAILGVVGMFLANKYEARDGSDTMPSMVAVLDTNFWLASHVTTIVMGYGASLLSGAIAHVYLLSKMLRIKRNDKAFYTNIHRMVYGTLCFGFFFTCLGTVLGGIWANESWGRFWGWDPKENGALLIVLWQLAMFHARLGGYIGQRGLCVAAVLCNMVIAFSWWGVNLLGVGLHSYGFTSGTMNTLIVFWGFETAVALGGLLAITKQRCPAQGSA